MNNVNQTNLHIRYKLLHLKNAKAITTPYLYNIVSQNK